MADHGCVASLKNPSPFALIHWRSYKRVPGIGLDPFWRSWLLDRGSLTERLVRATEGNFFVRVIQQGWLRPHLSEATRLRIKPGQMALVREVQLMCHKEAWVHARSVFPLSTLSGSLGYLKNLGNKSLGSLLFKEPSLKRTLFEIASMRSRPIAPPEQSLSDSTLWGRRSLFYAQQMPILVTEIFLPALKTHMEQHQL